MSLSIDWAPRASKERERLDATTRARVLAAIERYAETSHGDVRRLQGTDDEYRLRVGDWRVRFSIDTATMTLKVLRVLHRREAYR
ncbi:MAG TPA: type II toxin-antitoxin system RelE/ParE family toxin [Polyangiaceae bacterium]